MKKNILALIVGFITTAVFAVKPVFPLQCKVSGLRYKNANILFFQQHTAKPRLYVIHNISNKVVWFTHDNHGRGMGAGWDSRLTAHKWSAILVTKPAFSLSCRMQESNGPMKTVSCQKVVRVCQFSWLYSKNPVSGGYWVGEELALPNLLKRIHERGFEV